MPLLLYQIRPKQDEVWKWQVLRSDSPHALDDFFKTVEDAGQFVTNGAKNCEHSILVIVHNELDRPDRAYAVKGGVWRDLGLVARHPVEGEDVRLYPGER